MLNTVTYTALIKSIGRSNFKKPVGSTYEKSANSIYS